MNLDGQKVNVGDSVYDILEGQGQVAGMDSTVFLVRFGQRVSYTYNSAGQRTGNTPSRFPRLLFWQDPIVMIPVKEEAKWLAMKNIFLNAYTSLKGI